ncbi:hypothetical protein KDL01_32155 [Actinospica durhamensis]|uniref:Uncharacterized protein n=1 Tax=Actinospica durhamensis TaxID=1508375 RepID=A0A941EUL5_9ACTN|nr:hypothetical protein [Actinospica durhamensis]MBR7837970.1 hypothetical protein [Actinospica durhamensis]
MKNVRRLRYVAPAVLALVLGTAPGASANTGLASGAVVANTTAQNFQYTATWDYWSVTAVVPTSTSNYELYLFGPGGSYLGASTYGAGLTDFMAVDSNTGTRSLPQTYDPEVTLNSAGRYWIQSQYGDSEVSIPTPTHQGTTGFSDPDISYMILDSNNVVSISDIYLTAGESFWASTPTAADNVFLLEADPSYSSTWVQSRAIATIREHTQVIDNCTLYTATITGWHALVMIDDTQPVATSPQQGVPTRCRS